MMLYDTPLRKHHAAWTRREPPHHASAPVERPGAATGHREPEEAVQYVPYGPPDATEAQCELPATFGSVETEYAAVRRAAGLLDAPNRGTLRLTGADRRDFLDRLLTQELKGLAGGRVAESFWLNRRGRIEADLLLVETGDALLVDVDVYRAEPTARSFDSYLFAEDVAIEDATARVYRLSVQGPAAGAVLDAAADGDRFGEGAATLPTLRGIEHTIASVDVVAARRDAVGAPGLELFVPRDEAGRVWEALLDAGEPQRVRPVGWFAFNTARIEAGTPLFNVDYAGTNLPHETGVLATRVSFTKGCYLGQEIVARTEHLGRPRQKLVGLRVEGDALPVAGGQVFAGDAEPLSEPIGVVTSSTLSPMLGSSPVAFAMLKGAHAEEGTRVLVNAEGDQCAATVGPLAHWRPSS